MTKFVYNFRIAKDGPWEIISKDEKYLFGLYFGKVKRWDASCFLIIFGPIYFVFGWKNNSTN